MLDLITTTSAICITSLVSIIGSVQSSHTFNCEIQQDLAACSLKEATSVVNNMNDEFTEALLLWNEKGSSILVNQWLQQHGLNSTPIKAGLLISGTRTQFETVFTVDLNQAQLPLELTIPAELKEHVLSIGIPKRRQPY